MTFSVPQTKTYNVTISGSSFFYKFLYNNSVKLLKISRIHCIDTWVNKTSDKVVYVTRIKFKRFEYSTF